MNLSELLNLPEMRSDLERVGTALHASVASDDQFLTEVATHLIAAGGKRLRPSMAVAAALTCTDGPVAEEVIAGAVSVELVHLGSLYHDDVLDDATTRRTVTSVNAEYGNFMAVISGDYLLAKASGIAAALGTEVAGLLANTIAQLCEGQVREAQFAFNPDRPLAAYEKSIAGKTASLLATSARIGALTAGLSRTEVDALTAYGHGFGMAFQVRDDILDVIGTDEQLGKPAGNDLVEGVYTLPVLLALQSADTGAELRSLLGKPIAIPERDKARDIVRLSPGVTEAIAIGRQWSQQSVDALTVLPDSEMTRHLAALADGIFDDIR